MSSSEIYKKYLEALSQRVELEQKIESYIQKWQQGETALSTESIEEVVNKGYERLENLKQLEAKLTQEYDNQTKKEEDKRNVNISVHYQLGTMPSDIKITGGVLARNANESHLTAERKTTEELEAERQSLLASIKSKVQSGEIDLAQASKLANDVNISYNFYDRIEETKDSMSR